MTNESIAGERPLHLAALPASRRIGPLHLLIGASIAVLFYVLYRRSFTDLWFNWNVRDSYYSHGPLVPLISLYFVWRQRAALLAAPIHPAPLGLAVVLFACLFHIIGGFLGFALFLQFSMIPLFLGLILVFLGPRHAALLWFPLVFLLFMIPIPYSLTTSISFTVKLWATEAAVWLCQLVTLPMIRDGSWVIFGDDRLLVGEVCGGLRSLIALLAFGAVMSRLSKSRPWAKLLMFVISAPVAIIANIIRIFCLCVIGYFWGSQSVVGLVHDISGIFIFVIAFILLFTVETILRRVAPERTQEPAP